MDKQEDKTKTDKKDAAPKLKGRYIEAIGRRKRSVARVRLYKKGKGIILVNDHRLNRYFSDDKVTTVKQPLKLTGVLKDLDFSIVVKGGGSQGQAEAVRHGISRALVKINEEYKPALKAKGWISRDARRKERKKPGLRKARRAPQWSKR